SPHDALPISYRRYLKIAIPAPMGMSGTSTAKAVPGSGSAIDATTTAVAAKAEAYTNHLSCRRCSPRDRTSRTTSDTAQTRNNRGLMARVVLKVPRRQEAGVT